MSNAFKLRLILTALCLVVPSLSLLPFGAAWLIERGYALYWVGAAFVFVVSAFLAQLYLMRGLKPKPTGAAPSLHESEDKASALWTPREREAWVAVLALADTADLDELGSWAGIFALGQRTVEAVAQTLHPEEREPLWRFTAPELLTLFERVSQNLRPLVINNVPLGDQLTIGQILRIYRWRSAIDIGQRGYDVWRVIRLFNPATAVTQELRERMSKQMYYWGREEIARRMTRAYVKEVGRAAIDLYGGRLRVSAEDLAAHVSDVSKRDEGAALLPSEPLRILIGGQTNAGKSSLIEALAGVTSAGSDVVPQAAGYRAFSFEMAGAPKALLIESPAFSYEKAALRLFAEQARQCDFLLWVLSATRADRDADLAALSRIRAEFAAMPHRRPPPALYLLTHIDQLRPFQEWQPPYDIGAPTTKKASAIKAAIDVAASELGMTAADIIPVCLDKGRGLYNVDAATAAIKAKLIEAEGARLTRTLEDMRKKSFKWRRLGGQSLNAGRLLARAFLEKK